MITWLLIAPAISCHGVLLRSCAQDKGVKTFTQARNFKECVSPSVKKTLDEEADLRGSQGVRLTKAATSAYTDRSVLLPVRTVDDAALTEYIAELFEARWAAQGLLCESDQLFLAAPMAAT